MTAAFGFLAARAAVPDTAVAELVGRLRALAAREGHHLDRVFIDRPGTSGYAELMKAVRSAPGAVVIVPSLDHLARLESLQELIRLEIEEAGGHLLDVGAQSAVMREEE
ncbi:hypothetical protein O4J56_04700 [Nocardiopsis sp. RSe5-2]|uniref:Resolvase/invertase-type recombinase catalytic domain-containing protein n=1 Tax=Nocardiopsis endophytica TaxID=3018445 RepID=A0ABT4TYZ6_9ACTN|nr:hypothetical protein [Nocardiopsis endophytica]MDA2809928.1 hypothetical protein [Nocardiopsis endophytica]